MPDSGRSRHETYDALPDVRTLRSTIYGIQAQSLTRRATLRIAKEYPNPELCSGEFWKHFSASGSSWERKPSDLCTDSHFCVSEFSPLLLNGAGQKVNRSRYTTSVPSFHRHDQGEAGIFSLCTRQLYQESPVPAPRPARSGEIPRLHSVQGCDPGVSIRSVNNPSTYVTGNGGSTALPASTPSPTPPIRAQPFPEPS